MRKPIWRVLPDPEDARRRRRIREGASLPTIRSGVSGDPQVRQARRLKQTSPSRPRPGGDSPIPPEGLWGVLEPSRGLDPGRSSRWKGCRNPSRRAVDSTKSRVPITAPLLKIEIRCINCATLPWGTESGRPAVRIDVPVGARMALESGVGARDWTTFFPASPRRPWASSRKAFR